MLRFVPQFYLLLQEGVLTGAASKPFLFKGGSGNSLRHVGQGRGIKFPLVRECASSLSETPDGRQELQWHSVLLEGKVTSKPGVRKENGA